MISKGPFQSLRFCNSVKSRIFSSKQIPLVKVEEKDRQREKEKGTERKKKKKERE